MLSHSPQAHTLAATMALLIRSHFGSRHRSAQHRHSLRSRHHDASPAFFRRSSRRRPFESYSRSSSAGRASAPESISRTHGRHRRLSLLRIRLDLFRTRSQDPRDVSRLHNNQSAAEYLDSKYPTINLRTRRRNSHCLLRDERQ